MSSYILNTTMGVAAPLFATDKGDVSNRVKCAGAQLGNNARSLVEDVVVIGGTAAGLGAAAKGGKFTKFMEKCFNSVANACKPLIADVAKSKFWNKIKSLPMANKRAMVAVGAIGLLASSFVAGKNLYKKGQIDQQYTDKAKLEKAIKEHV